MGDCHCSNISIMQLFHELKQQFPGLPDHVVSQCIAQNSHDKEICAKSLRATQQSRPSPGAFPPPAPDVVNNQQFNVNQNKEQGRAHRPASLNFDSNRQRCARMIQSIPNGPPPSSAPPGYSVRGFFEEPNNNIINDTIDNCNNTNIRNLNSTAGGGGGFKVNVNVACNTPGEIRSQSADSRLGSSDESIYSDHTRSYTSVSLTLRPPSSEPQPPIDIRSQGSSLTYSASSMDPRGFQSRLQISIGPGNFGSVAAARLRPSIAHARINSTITTTQTTLPRPPGLPAGPPSQLPRPTTVTSAPTTPSAPAVDVTASTSLPATPLTPAQPIVSSPTENLPVPTDLNRLPLNQLTESQRSLIAEQLQRKEGLAKELKVEKAKLETMKKELQALLRPIDPSVSPQKIKKELDSDIYQLRLECNRLAEEVDQRSDPRVPFGETNEEFYQDIYTGQPLNFRDLDSNSELPFPLPSVPPVWQPRQLNQNNREPVDDEDKDGPPWVCSTCTFNNHPLMDTCEQCDISRFPTLETGGTQDIHIRVTHHHNFSPRRTVHSWVV